MKNDFNITCSIVLFEENLSDLYQTINCFLKIPLQSKLYLIENTPIKFYEYLFTDDRIEYIATEKNIGFGAAHNLILHKIKENSDFHLVLNPDVFFNDSVVPNLITELKKDDDVIMIAPKVLFLNGAHQYSCRRYPSIIELVVRRFYFLKPVFKSIVYKGEYREKDLTKPFFAEYLAGCFQLYKTSEFIKLNGFDERYFLYMEDVDICKKIDIIGKKKLYYPKEEIVHILKQGSLKNINLFFNHLFSAIKYFLKWGIK